MKELPLKFSEELSRLPETGMGYQSVVLTLKDETRYAAMIANGYLISRVKGFEGIPFDPEDVVAIDVTHEKF